MSTSIMEIRVVNQLTALRCETFDIGVLRQDGQLPRGGLERYANRRSN